MVEKSDYVEQLIAQWNRQRPELDVAPMGLIGRISRISRLLERQIEELFAAHGLQGGRFDVLAALVRAGEPHRLTPTQLYNSLLVSSGAITNRIDRLVDDGLVTRGSNASDGRSLPVQLTEAGRQRLDAALIAHLENEEELLAPLNRRERELLAEILRRWLIALGDQDHPAESLSDDSTVQSQ
ncbi:MAG TPA: MarR family transcriptional regulator [Acidimicrobiia bacterium]|nr:MarR family transcriptional regulator [Acidimicrobiia bacterium]